ncbi:MAG: glycosyltransferase family 4 protein [Thermodesulfobacteriota bacterium]
MKKVLLITYMFPPIAGGGIQRTLKFIKYLPANGITPIVFCPERAFWMAMDHHNLELPYLKKTRIHRCGVHALARYYRLRYEKGLRNHPYFYWLGLRYIWRMDYFSSWYLECRRRALSVAEEEKVDCVFTTSPPHSVHFFGSYLKAKLGIPWLMDLRDAMKVNPHRDLSKISGRLEAFMEGFYEKKFYRQADAVISVSQPILDSICKRQPFHGCGGKTHLITNGFDDEDFQHIGSGKMSGNGRLVITYTGSFLGKQTPEHFLTALSALCVRKEIDPRDIHVRFIGHYDEGVCSLIRSHATAFEAQIISHQPYDKALAYQADSDLLLLVNSIDKDQGGDQIFTGKFFEYLGAMRPIFALTPDGPLKETIEKGRFGVVVPPRDIDAIAIKMKELYAAWQSEKRLPYDPDMELRNGFTRKKLAEKLASLIQECA